MEITEVRIRKRFDGVPLCAVASVTFDRCFTVHDIKVVYAGGRYFTVMPNRKAPDGRLIDVAHPIDRAFRERLEQRILEAYFADRELNKDPDRIV